MDFKTNILKTFKIVSIKSRKSTKNYSKVSKNIL